MSYGRILTRYCIEVRHPNGFPEGVPFEYFDEGIAWEAIGAAEAVLHTSVDEAGVRRRLERVVREIRAAHPEVREIILRVPFEVSIGPALTKGVTAG